MAGLDMALYAIGDIQGCMTSLERLLERLHFEPAVDRVWLVGDLVNRGPRSLDVLRWARALGDRAVCVLGNHDVHLLARAAGVAAAKKRDTLEQILAAHDRDELIDWLRRRPFVHVEDGFVMVHAGLHPRWTVDEARALAGELEARLAGDDWKYFLAQLAAQKDPTPTWASSLGGPARARAILAYLIRVRTCHADGTVEAEFDGPPEEAPKGTKPWFALPQRAWSTHVPIFGHWAALGLDITSDHIALDSGCVWGHSLTAIKLPQRTITQVKAQEG
jgi:bis(5'-nucleosyl)-tetraphosphatase (symmetrical)